MGHLKDTRFVLRGTRKGPFDVPEQFALQEIGRQGTTVYGHKLSASPLAVGMNSPGEEFLPRSALSIDEHRAVCWRNLSNLIKYLEDLRVLTHNIAEAKPIQEFLAKINVLFHQPFFL